MPVTLQSACTQLCWTIKQAFLFIPVYLVVILICADWYIFVVQWGINRPHASPAGAYALCVVFSAIVVMVLWSYARTILTSSSVHDNPPPLDYYMRLRQLFPGQPDRVCLKCDGAPKPLRSHHCSICGKCILKMDHHCPWVATCVGFKNYKYFVLFVLWGCVGCSLYLVAGIELLTSNFSDPNNGSGLASGFAGLLTSLLTGAFAVSLLFFAAFHMHLVFTGQSTIEASLNRRNNAARRLEAAAAAAASGDVSQRLTHPAAASSGSGAMDLEAQAPLALGSPRDGGSPIVPTASAASPSERTHFSAGSRRDNFEAVFGRDPWLWFLPIDTLVETGYEFDFLLDDEDDEEQEEDLRPITAASSAFASSAAAHAAANERARAGEDVEAGIGSRSPHGAVSMQREDAGDAQTQEQQEQDGRNALVHSLHVATAAAGCASASQVLLEERSRSGSLSSNHSGHSGHSSGVVGASSLGRGSSRVHSQDYGADVDIDEGDEEDSPVLDNSQQQTRHGQFPAMNEQRFARVRD